MVKRMLSLVSGLLIFVSISSLYAFEIPFLGGNEKTEIILATNAIELSYSEYAGFSGHYELFSLSNANNGFFVTFEIMDNFMLSSDTVILMAGSFNRDYLSKVGETNAFAVLALTPTMFVDMYINNKKVSKTGAFGVRVIELDEKLFNNKMRFEDNSKNKLSYELSDKYKEVVYKKIQIYLRKNAEAIGKK